MADSVSSAVSRREFLYSVAVAAAPVAFLAQVQSSFGQDTGSALLEPTPAVADADLQATPQETIGTAFKPDSPLKNNFRESGPVGLVAGHDNAGFCPDRPRGGWFAARTCH